MINWGPVWFQVDELRQQKLQKEIPESHEEPEYSESNGEFHVLTMHPRRSWDRFPTDSKFFGPLLGIRAQPHEDTFLTTLID